MLHRVVCVGVVGVLAATLMATAAAPAIASGSRSTTLAELGEEGSGPAPLPIVRTDGTSLTRTRSIAFSDIGLEDAWAARAISHVAGTYTWMRDFAPDADGRYRFRPDAIQSRKYFARALVRAFVPGQIPDPSIVFTDLDPSSPWLRWAAVAVQNGWMTAVDGRFAPDDPVTMTTVHRGLIWALGLRQTAGSLNRIHTATGQTFKVPTAFGSLVLGLRLGLRYNAPTGSESLDVAPRDRLTRAQVAYSLFKAKTLPSWSIDDVREQYADVTLPFLGPKKYAMVQWGIRYVGYPYVWGGEWGLESPEPTALGGQPRSGFDCSGLSWWLLRASEGGAWHVAPPRPYFGWALAQRTSADMARNTTVRLSYDELRPGDLMFYDGDDDGTVDHVDTYIGNGFALDSSNTPGGVTIMWVGDGWYRDHFVHGRRILPD